MKLQTQSKTQSHKEVYHHPVHWTPRNSIEENKTEMEAAATQQYFQPKTVGQNLNNFPYFNSKRSKFQPSICVAFCSKLCVYSIYLKDN